MPSTLPGNGVVGSSVDGGRIGSGSSSASSRDDRSPKQISKHQQQQQHQHHHHHPSLSTPSNIAEAPTMASQSHTNGQQSSAAAVASAAGTPLAVNLKLNAAISTATSPLIENGNGTGGGNPNVFLPEKFLPSTAASPSDLRKEYDVTKVNGKYRSTNFVYLFIEHCWLCWTRGGEHSCRWQPYPPESSWMTRRYIWIICPHSGGRVHYDYYYCIAAPASKSSICNMRIIIIIIIN